MWEASFRNPRSLVISLDGNERILTHEIKIKLKISISYFKSWIFFLSEKPTLQSEANIVFST